MRRKDREITDRDYMYEFIARADVCHLAMIDTLTDPAMPYVLPLNFGFEAAKPGQVERFWFHCANEGRKLDIIRACNRVCVQLDVNQELVTGPLACDWGMKFASVIAEGVASIVDNDRERRAGLDALMRHHDKLNGGKIAIKRDAQGNFIYDENHLRATTVIRVDVSIMSAKLRS